MGQVVLAGLGFVFGVGAGGGDAVAFVQPAAKVDIRAAARAEGAVFGFCLLGADRAGHGRISFKGRRSRLRVISNNPSVVQPARLVSAASVLKAARRT